MVLLSNHIRYRFPNNNYTQVSIRTIRKHSDEISASSVDAAPITDNKLNIIGSANLKVTRYHGEQFYSVVHVYANVNVKP